jgi:3-oxoacyl-[acyl-carrier-protein] synthase-1
MTTPDPVIVGAGAVTALGLSIPEIAAAVLARSARFTESPFRDRHAEPLVLATVPEEALPPLDPVIDAQPAVSSRERRMLRLAGQSLGQLRAALPANAQGIPLSIALPRAVGPIAIDGMRFVERLAIQSGLPIAITASTIRQEGRAGGILALGDARDQLQRGLARYVIAGGVDSYRDSRVIAALDAARRIKTSSNLDAFIPGEGATFLLLTTAAQAEKDGREPLARCSVTAASVEEGHLHASAPYRGEALSHAVRELMVAGNVPGPVTDVFSSMNGEHHWGREWSIAFMRQRALFDEPHHFHHPADSFGDIGAAAGPTLVALAAVRQHKRQGRSPALVYCSSDDGPRAAMFVHQGA